MYGRRAALMGTMAVLAASAALAGGGRHACAQGAAVRFAPVTDWKVVPKRAGALDWAALVRHAVEPEPVRIAADVLALNGTTVEIDGYFLPYVPDVSKVFLLTPYETHCEGCVPNRPFSVVGVSSRIAVDDDGSVRTMRGRFTIAPDNPSGYPFWILDAEPA
jgi:hypothetical protein